MIFIKIIVCIGSGCHVKGSRDIINKLQRYMERENEQIEIDLSACFCQNHCTEGVIVKFNDQLVKNVSKDNIIEILEQRLAEGE